MADEQFRVRHTAFAVLGESNKEEAVINRMGASIVADCFDQLALSGHCYHIQYGTEDAGIASTVGIDPALSFGVVDNPAGRAMIPLLYEINPGVIAGATIVQAMLEIDKAKARFSSGGSDYVPANLRSDTPQAATGVFKVGPDVTCAAKSAVPDSVELARKFYIEDALANTLGYPGAWDTIVYSIRTRPLAMLVDVASCVQHFGAPTADATGYGVLQFAQLDKALLT